jgi:hypothetical protein
MKTDIFDVYICNSKAFKLGPRPSRWNYFWFLMRHPRWLIIELKCRWPYAK